MSHNRMFYSSPSQYACPSIASLCTKVISYALILSLVFPASAFAKSRIEYVSVKGDTVSEITWALVPGRLYGRDGALSRVRSLNPKINNANRIYPGQIVILPNGIRYLIERISRQPENTLNPNFKNKEQVIARIRMISEQPFAQVMKPEINEGVENPPALAKEDPAVETKKETVASEKRDHAFTYEDSALQKSGTTLESLAESRANVELIPFYRMTGIKLSDSNQGNSSTLGSKFYTGLDVNYVQEWNKRFHSLVHFNAGFISFENPGDSSKNLETSDHFMSGIGAGVRYLLSESAGLEAHARYQKELFGRATSTTNVTVDAVSVPSLKLAVHYDFFRKSIFSLGIQPFYQILFATEGTSYPIKRGQSIGGTIYLKQYVSGKKRPRFQTEIGFFTRDQASEQIEQRESALFLNLRFFFGLNNESLSE